MKDNPFDRMMQEMQLAKEALEIVSEKTPDECTEEEIAKVGKFYDMLAGKVKRGEATLEQLPDGLRDVVRERLEDKQFAGMHLVEDSVFGSKKETKKKNEPNYNPFDGMVVKEKNRVFDPSKW
jgi:hypothetical protein